MGMVGCVQVVGLACDRDRYPAFDLRAAGDVTSGAVAATTTTWAKRRRGALVMHIAAVVDGADDGSADGHSLPGIVDDHRDDLHVVAGQDGASLVVHVDVADVNG